MKLWAETKIAFETDLKLTEELIPFVKIAVIIEDPAPEFGIHGLLYGTTNTPQDDGARAEGEPAIVGEDIIFYRDTYYYYGDASLLYVDATPKTTPCPLAELWRGKYFVSTNYPMWSTALPGMLQAGYGIYWNKSGIDNKYRVNLPYASYGFTSSIHDPEPVQVFYDTPPTNPPLLPLGLNWVNDDWDKPWGQPNALLVKQAPYDRIYVKRNTGISYADVIAINPTAPNYPPNPAMPDNTKQTYRFPNVEEGVDWRVKGKMARFPWNKYWVKIGENEYRLRVTGNYLKWVDYTIEQQEYTQSTKAYRPTYRRTYIPSGYYGYIDEMYYTYFAGESQEFTMTKELKIANANPDNLRLIVSYMNENSINETRQYKPKPTKEA